MKHTSLRLASLLFAAAITAASLAGCAKNASGDSVTMAVASDGEYYSASGISDSYKYDYGYEQYEAVEAEEVALEDVSYSSDDTYTASEDTRKIIRTMQITAETLDFDASVQEIQSSVSACGGYVESSNISGNNLFETGGCRYANFTLRVPAEKLDDFVSALGDGINIVSKYENSSDITDSYYDAAARLKSLETQEERLLAMLEGATELQYMLELEDHLADVRYQIESYNSQLQRYDSQVSMSTLTINLDEVIEYNPPVTVPKTFGERIAIAFTNSWADFADGCQEFAVEFVYAIPALLVLALIVLVIVLIVRRIIKKYKAKKEALLAYQSFVAANNSASDTTNNPTTDK